MSLPVSPPLPPMLGKLARELPASGHLYEPKWDGFRCLAFRDGAGIDLRSRHGRPLSRYFPELVEALAALEEERLVLDGEAIVLAGRGGDFEALAQRRPELLVFLPDDVLERVERIGDAFDRALELGQSLPQDGLQNR